MTRPLRILALTTASLLLTACFGFDQHSYQGGRDYVEMRQPAANWSDAQALTACGIYSDGFAQLDDYDDGEAFLRGCADAAADTDFQPVVDDRRPTSEEIDAMIRKYLAETEARR